MSGAKTKATQDDAHELKEAQMLLTQLESFVTKIVSLSTTDELGTEEEFNSKVNPVIEEATSHSKQVDAYLQENKKHKDNPEIRRLHKSYVQAMKGFQTAHSDAAAKREAICDQALLQDVHITAADLEVAKEQEEKAVEIAETAIEVKELYAEVNSIVHNQTAGIEHIGKTVENTKLEIGEGVDELAQAERLQREARQKTIILVLLIVLVLSAILIPIVVSLIPSD